MRCLACRRPLTNPVSIRHGLGPDCLKRAVRDGTAPLEALVELTDYQRSLPRKRIPKAKSPAPELTTPDLFDMLREAALDDLSKAVSVCESVGIIVKIEIT